MVITGLLEELMMLLMLGMLYLAFEINSQPLTLCIGHTQHDAPLKKRDNMVGTW